MLSRNPEQRNPGHGGADQPRPELQESNRRLPRARRWSSSHPRRRPRPEEAARVVPVREEMLQERLGDRYRRLDVPLKVEWEDKSREPILFLVEEESDQHRFSPRRLAYYDLDLGGMFNTVRVVPGGGLPAFRPSAQAAALHRAGRPTIRSATCTAPSATCPRRTGWTAATWWRA